MLFEDSPSSSPSLSGPDRKSEVFGTSAEEAVREMRFRIEQKTSLTASAGERGENFHTFLTLKHEHFQIFTLHIRNIEYFFLA